MSARICGGVWHLWSWAKNYENIFASIGIHPHSAAEVSEEDFQRIPGLLKNEKVVAVGEVGLDYYRNLSPQGQTKRAIFPFHRIKPGFPASADNPFPGGRGGYHSFT